MDRQIHWVAIKGSVISIGVEQKIENMGKRRSKDVSKKGDDDRSMNETFNLDEEEEEDEEDVISLANVYRQVHSHLILRIDSMLRMDKISYFPKLSHVRLHIAETSPFTHLHTDSSGP